MFHWRLYRSAVAGAAGLSVASATSTSPDGAASSRTSASRSTAATSELAAIASAPLALNPATAAMPTPVCAKMTSPPSAETPATKFEGILPLKRTRYVLVSSPADTLSCGAGVGDDGSSAHAVRKTPNATAYNRCDCFIWCSWLESSGKTQRAARALPTREPTATAIQRPKHTCFDCARKNARSTEGS